MDIAEEKNVLPALSQIRSVDDLVWRDRRGLHKALRKGWNVELFQSVSDETKTRMVLTSSAQPDGYILSLIPWIQSTLDDFLTYSSPNLVDYWVPSSASSVYQGAVYPHLQRVADLCWNEDWYLGYEVWQELALHLRGPGRYDDGEIEIRLAYVKLSKEAMGPRIRKRLEI